MKKILIVDDLDTYVQRERSILNRSDFKIFTATSGEDALTMHRAEHMDMLIIDMDMPGMSGDKLCSMIRKDEKLKNVSVVMVCSNTRSDIERSNACMANAYVTKPLNTVQFLMTVSRLLDIQERKSYRVLIKLSVSGKARSESFFCYSRDISSSGILIETDKVLEKGTIMLCSFFLPNSERIVTDAEIMRVVTLENKTFQYGARFTKIDAPARSAIETFVNNAAGKR